MKLIVLIATVFFIFSCNSDYTSKKRGYFKIDFPPREYVQFNDSAFPFSFEYPKYATIAKDTSYFDSSSSNPYWFNVVFPQFNGKIYVSYKRIGGKSIYKVKKDNRYIDSAGINNFENMVADAYKITFKNQVKAYSIEDSLMHTPHNLTGVFFNVTGNVATANQFFLSDTTRNFLRGALYFDATPNEDSLQIVNNFLRQDMLHMINTLKWR
ncbi:hypothetical protein BH09BAC2_BH09BAC2_01680 [soil metagenome]